MKIYRLLMKLKKVFFLIKTQGITEAFILCYNKLLGKNIYPYKDIVSVPYLFSKDVPACLSSIQFLYKNQLTLSWFIPPPGKHSGGHINIMNIIKYLDSNNVINNIYFISENENMDSSWGKEILLKYYDLKFQNVNDVCFITHPLNVNQSHFVFATSWHSAYFIRKVSNCLEKYYLVQDFESSFYPSGSMSLLAQNTYKFGYNCITAGVWLKNLLLEKFHAKARDFGFFYNDDLYSSTSWIKNNRILCYARPSTERRAFELLSYCLGIVKKTIPEIEIAFIGEKIKGYVLPYKFTDFGAVEQKQLNKIYGESLIVIAFSSTNISLLPLEVMSSGTAFMTNNGDNVEWLCTNENSILVNSDPFEVCQTIITYLSNPDLLEIKAKSGIEFSKSISMDKELSKIHNYLSQDLEIYKNKKQLLFEINNHLHDISNHKTAIYVHLHYPDLISNFLDYIERIDHNIDFIITISCLFDNEHIMLLKKNIPNLKIFHFENQGRDVYPFMKLGSLGVFDQYDHVCKIHGKKSMHIISSSFVSGDVWREQLWNSLIGSQLVVEKVIAMFASDNNLALVGSKKFFIGKNDSLFDLKTNKNIKQALSRFDLNTDEFFSGTMFWFRPVAFKKFFMNNISLDFFPAEAGQINNTEAHVIERLFLSYLKHHGYTYQFIEG